jgi:hypothetical protein
MHIVPEQYLNASNAARALGISLGDLKQLVWKCKLHITNIGGITMLYHSEIEAMLQANQPNRIDNIDNK